MSATNTLETGLLNLIFRNQDLANIGDAAGLQNSATDGSLFVGLMTGVTDGEAGTVTEANYTGYARVGVSRTNGWTVTGNGVDNAAAITFGACTAGSNTVTHFGIWTALTGGTLLFWGTLTASLAISAGITPEIAIGALDITVD